MIPSRWVLLLCLAVGLILPLPLTATPLNTADITLDKNETTLATTWSFVPHAWLSENQIRTHQEAQEGALPFAVPGGVKEAIVAAQKDPALSDWGTAYIILRNFRSTTSELGLRLRADTAYHIYWVNLSSATPWKRVAAIGTPATSREASIPMLADTLIKLPYTGPGDYALVIHLSGFHYAETSIWKAPVIGSHKQMESAYLSQLITTFFVAGMIFIMAIYYLSLFIHHPEDRSSLWLMLFTFVVLLRYVGTAPEIISLPFIKPSVALYEILRKMEFGLLGLGGVFGMLYTAETFKFERVKKFAFYNLIPAGLWAFFCLVTRAPTYQPLLLPVALYIFMMAMLCFGFAIKAAHGRLTGSYLLVTGFFIFIATLINDLLVGLSVLRSSIFLLPFGLTGLLFMQGQVIAGLFAVAFRTAQRLTLHLKAEVARQTREIRSMLDHIPQGVLSFVGNGVADAHYSNHLENILETHNIAGLSLQDLILDRSSLNSDMKDRARAALISALGEDMISFELNSDQLPNEIELKVDDEHKKILELTWNAVPDEEDKVEKILVTLHDVTKIRQFQEESQAQRLQMTLIQEIVNVTAISFSQFIASATKFMEENHRLISSNSQKNAEVVKILFVNMHTIKGAARTLGFQTLTGAVHEAEQVFAGILKNADMSWDQQQLLSDHKTVLERLNEYQRINDEVLGRGAISAQNLVIDRNLLEESALILTDLLQYCPQGLKRERYLNHYQKLEEITFCSAEEFFREMLGTASKVARDLGKPEPALVISGIKVRVSYRLQELMRNAFTHLIRNSMDHGIEPAEERTARGKKPHGMLEVILSESDDGLIIKYRDNGRGLHLTALRQKGIERGIFSDTVTPSRQEIADLIFVSGLSTAQGVTQFSGRGVGMDAVKRYLEDAGGSIALELEEETGQQDFIPFSVCMVVPPAYYISSGEVIEVVTSDRDAQAQ
jgi:HPt (histidine-containing phosphotransfer) domain-containing protein